MAEAIKLDTLVTLIAAQSITVTNALGASVALNIRDMTKANETPYLGVPIGVNTQDCPLLMPRAADFVTNLVPTLDTNGGDAAYKSIKYNLNYQFLFYPLGEGGTWTAFYGQSVIAFTQVVLYFMTHSNQFSGQGGEDFFLGPIKIWSQSDATGTGYHGGEIAFTVEHLLEV